MFGSGKTVSSAERSNLRRCLILRVKPLGKLGSLAISGYQLERQALHLSQIFPLTRVNDYSLINR